MAKQKRCVITSKYIIHLCFALLIVFALSCFVYRLNYPISDKIQEHNISRNEFLYPAIYIKPRKLLKKYFLLILISSSPHDESHREKRNAIRTTWGQCDQLYLMYTESKQLPKDISCRLVFFMGRTFNDTSIIQESKQYGDILIADYIDSYGNITNKLLLTFKWSNQFPPTFVLKTDDDVFVHVPRLILKLVTIKDRRYYGGIIWVGTVNRDPKRRHFVSYNTFGESWFPPFCKGAFYVFSGELLPKLLQAVKRIKPFGVDDAYIGILMRELNVVPTHINEFIHVDLGLFIDFVTDCVMQKTIGLCDGLSAKQINYIHKRIKYIDLQKWFNCLQVPFYTAPLFLIVVLFVLFVRKVLLRKKP